MDHRERLDEVVEFCPGCGADRSEFVALDDGDTFECHRCDLKAEMYLAGGNQSTAFTAKPPRKTSGDGDDFMCQCQDCKAWWHYGEDIKPGIESPSDLREDGYCKCPVCEGKLVSEAELQG